MVDRDLVLRKISELDEYQNQVQEFKGITVKQYREDWKKQRIVERTLQLISLKSWEKIMFLKKSLSIEWKRWPNSEIIIGLLKRNLKDFDHFRKAVVGFVQKPQNVE